MTSVHSRASARSQGALASLHNVRARSKGLVEKTRLPKNKEKKDCEFLCGVDNLQGDDFCTSQDVNSPDWYSMRWAYTDGSGANCHPCERVWQTELSHHWAERASYKLACANDLELLKCHRERRLAWVARKKNKAWVAGRRAGGVKKTTVKSRQSDKINLIRPDDLFYPLYEYKENSAIRSPPNTAREAISSRP